jgi:S1-C subfamily serine protease
MDPAEAQHYGLPMGAYVSEVTPGYCAAEAGIQARDIITNVGGYEVEGLTDLTRALRNFKAGETVKVTVYRGGREVVLDVTLDEKPQVQEQQPQMPSEGFDMPQDGSFQEWYDYFAPFFGG